MHLNLDLLAKTSETIGEHTRKIEKVANLILSSRMAVIKRIAEKMPSDFFSGNKEKTEQVKEFILEIVRFHDYGKVNPYFQEHIRGGNRSKEERKHSIFSFYMWIASVIEKDELEEDSLFLRTILSYGSIVGHHGRLKELQSGLLEKEFRKISKTLQQLVDWDVLEEEEMFEVEDVIDAFQSKKVFADSPYILFICKFMFSVLVISDSISSSELPEEEYENAVKNLLCKDIGSTDFHETLQEFSIIKHVNESLLQPNDAFSSLDNMNDIRVLLNKKSSNAWNQDTDIYVLEAAVGTGKTISSLSLTNTIIQNEQKRKIISVFPLNSVQSQYVHTMTEEVNVDKRLLNVINSEVIFGLDKKGEDELSFTSSNLWLFERNCFSNEFLITSHVRFFDVLTGISRKSSLGFLNLMDSVVILDEFQNYPPHYWFGIWNELLMMSEMFGVKWVFTTGTFPVSEKQLQQEFGDRIKKVLTREENKELFTSPYVKDRTDILPLRKDKYKEVTDIGQDIVQDIRGQEMMGHSQFIVCLSFVKPTKEMYHYIKERMPEYQCYFLCGRHSPRYKRELVKVIHHHNKNRRDKVILITTKTVECGMDFDFDYGYKEFDMFDSVEQLSGRVNRSDKRKYCGVRTFLLQRKKLDHEKLYYYNGYVMERLRNKSFIELYEDMYRKNKVTMSQYKEDWDVVNQSCDFSEYKKKMVIIEEQDYQTDILVVKKSEEQELMDIIQSQPKMLSYSESVISSMRLRKQLEPFRMTVTTKWLGERIDTDLMETECNGIGYYVIENDETFQHYIETYELNGIVTYIEKETEDVEEQTALETCGAGVVQ